MGEDVKQKVDANSAEFKQGVEAGLNSEEDTKDWKAGNESDQELKGDQTKKPSSADSSDELSTPLFLRHRGKKGNDQDEEDETAE